MSTEETKKIEQTPEEKLNSLIQRDVELHSISKEVFKKTLQLHEKIEREMREMKKEMTSMLGLMTKKFKDQNSSLEKGVSVAETTEETLLNVLLAIRQNEYLQAWYPAQHGHPEMKVTGTHPAKQKKAMV